MKTTDATLTAGALAGFLSVRSTLIHWDERNRELHISEFLKGAERLRKWLIAAEKEMRGEG